jgi:hypothetical protein
LAAYRILASADRNNQGDAGTPVVLWKLDGFRNPRVIDVQDFVGDGSR